MSPSAPSKAPAPKKAPRVKDAGDDVEKEPKRKSFLEAPEAGPLMNAEKQLTARPQGVDFEKYRPLKRGDFANEADFLDHRADYFEWNSARLANRAVEARKAADNTRKYGNPAVRAQLKKLERMRASMAELEAQLKAAGAEV